MLSEESAKKLRRGEWLALAPRGFVNNPKTKNIEPDPVAARIIVKAYKEFATGKYNFPSLSKFLADLGMVGKNGTPLYKSAVSNLLSNKAYIGLVKHKNEWYAGSFVPIISPDLFEAVQEALERTIKASQNKNWTQFSFYRTFSLW